MKLQFYYYHESDCAGDRQRNTYFLPYGDMRVVREGDGWVQMLCKLHCFYPNMVLGEFEYDTSRTSGGAKLVPVVNGEINQTIKNIIEMNGRWPDSLRGVEFE